MLLMVKVLLPLAGDLSQRTAGAHFEILTCRLVRERAFLRHSARDTGMADPGSGTTVSSQNARRNPLIEM
jgi:hypothetical protein